MVKICWEKKTVKAIRRATAQLILEKIAEEVKEAAIMLAYFVKHLTFVSMSVCVSFSLNGVRKDVFCQILQNLVVSDCTNRA